jgi:hypothetical protein
MTTRTLTIELTASESAVFSRSAATATTHLTASYPKGANLLGWAARRFYGDLDKAVDAYTVFHSGKVRFSDAVRIVKEDAVFPNPAILLEPKHLGGEAQLGRAAYDEKYKEEEGTRPQAEAVKGRLVTFAGAEAPMPILDRRLRSAKNGGLNAEAALFDFESIQPGKTRFRATIEVDEDVSEEVWTKIESAFSGSIHIGRGHVTTYGGGYNCEVIENAPKVWPAPKEIAKDCTKVHLWLLSDAAFINKFGSPNLTPGPEDFGLNKDEWKQLNSETSTTSRRIWPWNSTYGSRDGEYAVIEAGSVFTFIREGGSAVTHAHLVGIGQERGFGRVAVLEDTEFKFLSSSINDEAAQPSADIAAIEDDPFILWLNSKEVATADVGLDRWVLEKTDEVKRRVKIAGQDGPSRSQWRNLFTTIDLYGQHGKYETLAQKDKKQEEDIVTKRLSADVSQSCWDANYCGLKTWVQNELFPNRTAAEASKYKKYIKKIVDKAILAYGDVRS